MKLFFANSVLILLATLVFSSCLANPSRQSNVNPTAEIITQVNIAPPLPTSTSSPNVIYSNSPDNRYTIELELSETPVKLTIVDNASEQKTQIPISYRYYDKIVGDSSIGFKWSADNKILMFVLYREPFSEKREEDFSCFFAIDVEQTKPITRNYSSLFRGLWYQDESGIATLEHGGLNDIDDFYLAGQPVIKVRLKANAKILIFLQVEIGNFPSGKKPM